MEELASALPFGGAPYTYLSVPMCKTPFMWSYLLCSRLNVSSKWLALLGAAMLLLDYASTSVVSAATAAAYLSGEVSLPFPAYVGALLVVVVFTIVSLSGLRESARIALIVLSLHVRMTPV